jgi:hypothetical protein
MKAPLVGIDDKCGINACKLLGIEFTAALGILIRSCEKGLEDHGSALAKLNALALTDDIKVPSSRKRGRN